MKETWAEAAGAACRQTRDHFVEAVREEARKRLEGHKGVLDSMTHDQLRAISQMDEPAVMCGKLPK